MSGGAGEPRLVIRAGAWEAVAEHVEVAYPAEGCGVLLGRGEGAARVACEAVRAPNEWGGRDDRYAVDPNLVRDLMVREEEGGPAVLGFYHSHPDAEPVPSETDRELGWPWYHYLIVPVTAGDAGRPRLWRFDGRDGPAREGRVERRSAPGAEGARDGGRTARETDEPSRERKNGETP